MRYIKNFLFIILILTVQPVISQTSQAKTLLIGEFYTDKENDEQYQTLIGLTFQDGKLIQRDTIYSGPTLKKKGDEFHSFFRIEFSNIIYRDRYLITFGGAVIDMKTKEMIKEDDGRYKEASGDTLIFFTENLFRGNYFSYLNLSTRNITHKEIKNYRHDYSEEVFSPSGKYYLDVDYSKLPYKIYLVKGKQKELIVPNAGMGSPMNGGASFPIVPLYWTDSTHFLFARFDRNFNPWISTGTVILYNIKRKSELIIGYLGKVKDYVINARFLKDEANGLMLMVGHRYFHINHDSIEVVEKSRFNLENSFSYDLYVDDDWRQKIYFENSEIGNLHFLESFATSNYVALGLRDKGTYTGSDKIGIWNNYTKDWLIIPEPHLIEIIGWIDE